MYLPIFYASAGHFRAKLRDLGKYGLKGSRDSEITSTEVCRNLASTFIIELNDPMKAYHNLDFSGFCGYNILIGCSNPYRYTAPRSGGLCNTPKTGHI